MDRSQKEAFVSDLNARLQDVESVVVTHYRGLSVPQMEELRSEMRKNDATLEVAKNRLVKLAFKGTSFEGIADLMQGPCAIATSSDPVAAAKVAHTFAKDNEQFVILGGALGEKRLEVEEISALAKLPSLDALRGQLIGLLQAPAGKIARLSKEPGAQVARIVAQKPEAA